MLEEKEEVREVGQDFDMLCSYIIIYKIRTWVMVGILLKDLFNAIGIFLVP